MIAVFLVALLPSLSSAQPECPNFAGLYRAEAGETIQFNQENCQIIEMITSDPAGGRTETSPLSLDGVLRKFKEEQSGEYFRQSYFSVPDVLVLNYIYVNSYVITDSMERTVQRKDMWQIREDHLFYTSEYFDSETGQKIESRSLSLVYNRQ